MKNFIKKRLLILLALLGALALTACGAGGDALPPEPEAGVLTYAILDPLTSEQKRRILNFNKSHTDVQIEVLDYSDEGGIDRLLTEFALGWVPDIMDLHRLGSNGEHRPTYGPGDVFARIGGKKGSEGEYWMPYRQLARKGYLEDLWPYIENDPDLGLDGVLMPPLKAAEVDGGLYMLFREVYVDTLVGMESVVGDRDGWTLEELLETFSTMPEGSTILRYNATRWEIYSQIFCMTLDRYIDWETGQCSFDNDEFRSMLEFLSAFPDEFKTALTEGELREEIVWRRLEGEQMLEKVIVSWLMDIPRLGTTFGTKPVAFIGYPTTDGSSGSFFNVFGTTLAMASTCQDKDAAWEFMRYLLLPAYSVSQINDAHWRNTIMTPVNRKSFENGNTADLEREKEDSFPISTFSGGPKFEVDPPTMEDLQRFENIINSTTLLSWPDNALSDIVWESIGPYFAGDKTLDETIQMVQNRVKLYVNENR